MARGTVLGCHPPREDEGAGLRATLGLTTALRRLRDRSLPKGRDDPTPYDSACWPGFWHAARRRIMGLDAAQSLHPGSIIMISLVSETLSVRFGYSR